MIAQEDDELWSWIFNCFRHAGGFLSTLADAALHASEDNYIIMRPMLLEFKQKFPKYSDPNFREHHDKH